MYGKIGIVTVVPPMATTGFGMSWYVTLACMLLVSGLLLVRWGRRRGATR